MENESACTNPSVILFRASLAEEGEERSARLSFDVYASRTAIPDGACVIGRYSVLPYYQELEVDLRVRGSRLIHSHRAHRYIADMEWVMDLDGVTPRTYDAEMIPHLPDGAYVLKGRTNSRKHQWNTHMFAPTRADVPSRFARLMDDPLIRDQGVVIRRYVPLVALGTGINGLPITNEWRTFWLRTGKGLHCVGRGFYWSNQPEVGERAQWTEGAARIAEWAAGLVREDVNFFVLDVAERTNGDWLVIEVNDGQMSGIPAWPFGVDAEQMYRRMGELLREEGVPLL